MQIDELRGELATLADEIAPFERDVSALHRSARRRRMFGSALVAALVIAVAASTLAVVRNREDGGVRVSSRGSKEVSLVDVTHVDVIVVPASPEVRDALDASPLVAHYALAPRGYRISSLTAPVTQPAICALQGHDGYAVQATAPRTDIFHALTGALARRANVYDVSDVLGFDLQVFLKVGTSSARAASVRAALKSDPEIATFVDVSTVEAYDIFKRDFADQPTLVQGTKPSDLPESFRIDLEPGASASTEAEHYRGLDGVDTVITSNGSDLLSKYSHVSPADVRRALAYGFAGPSQVEVFLTVRASTKQVESVRAALAADPAIGSVEFVDQNQAYSIFAKSFADQPSLVKSTKPSDLPASFRVVMKSATSARAKAAAYKKLDGVDMVIASDVALDDAAAKALAACNKP